MMIKTFDRTANFKTIGTCTIFRRNENTLFAQASAAWIMARMVTVIRIKRLTFFTIKTFAMESWKFLRINHIIMITFFVQYDFPISPGAFIYASVPSIKINHDNLVTRQDPLELRHLPQTARTRQDIGFLI